MPCTPMLDSASRTSSSLNGLMMAGTSFMVSSWCDPAWPDSERLLHEHDELVAGNLLAERLRVQLVALVGAGIENAGRDAVHLGRGADLPVGVVEVPAVL